MTTKAVILVGGSSRGTRFRPLALDYTKILFPIAGKPLLSHTVDALLKLETIREIILIGFYDEAVFADFVTEFNTEMKYVGRKCTLKYLREFKELGTAGGLYHFKDEIVKNNTSGSFIVVHGDIICSFPFKEMLDTYELKKKENGNDPDAVLFGINMDRVTYDVMIGLNINSKTNYGVIVESEGKLVHFVEKPESKISTIINGGIYLFNVRIFKMLSQAKINKITQSNLLGFTDNIDEDVLSMETDVLKKLPELGNTYVVNHKGFWKAIKAPSDALWANELYLDLIYQSKAGVQARIDKDPSKLEVALEIPSISIIPPVFIHPSTTINFKEGTKIGPYVSIGENCVIEKGTRISNSIILKNTHVGANMLIKNSIISHHCTLGAWARVEGTGIKMTTVTELIRKNGSTKMRNIIETTEAFKMIGIKDSGNISLLGSNTSVQEETIILNSFILPSKSIKNDIQHEVVM